MALKGLRRSDDWHMTLSRDCHLTIIEQLSYNRGLFEDMLPHTHCQMQSAATALL